MSEYKTSKQSQTTFIVIQFSILEWRLQMNSCLLSLSHIVKS